MKRIAGTALVLTLLAACSQESASSSAKGGDVENSEAYQLRQQIAALERKIQLLDAQIGSRPRASRASSAEVAVAQPAEGETQAAPEGEPGAAAASLATAEQAAPGVKAFLESDDGKKALATAVRTVQEQAEQERTARMIEDRLAQFAKDASLTDDQVVKMRDILTRSSKSFRDTFAALRDGGGDMPQAEREQARQTAMGKMQEIRKSMDDEARVVLSQTQFDQYQKAVAGAMGGFGFRGPGAPAGRGN